MVRWLTAAFFIVPSVVAAALFPKPVGFVNDFADLLPAESRQVIETKLASYERSSGREVVVVTVANLGDDTIALNYETLY